MLSTWRKAKISDHFLKPVFLFPVNDENWLTETHSNRRLSLNPFFQWSCHVHRVGIFPSKMRKTILFLFSRVHYLWTQYHCRQSSINYARNFHGSLILFIYLLFFFTGKMETAFKVKNTQNQWSIHHCQLSVVQAIYNMLICSRIFFSFQIFFLFCWENGKWFPREEQTKSMVIVSKFKHLFLIPVND